MNKAFLFDMDGVLADSEHAWFAHDERLLDEFFKGEHREQMGNSTGLGIRGIFAKAQEIGSQVDFETLASAYNTAALDVYENSPISEGIDELIAKLLAWNFRLGVVTSSPQLWIDKVVPRITSCDKFEIIVSLGERNDLKPKPAPDGYVAALTTLEADPKLSFVLEDSNYGIQAGKAAECFVIGYTGNLLESYRQSGADAYAGTMEEVAQIVSTRL